MLRPRLAAVLALLLTTPLFAYQRGDVLLENRIQSPFSDSSVHELWLHFGGRYAVLADAVPLIYKAVPYAGEGRFLIPAPNQILFHHQQVVSVWDGVLRNYWAAGVGYHEIFQDTTELGEIAPMRSGNFLVAERWNDPARGAKVIEFNTRGRVAEYAFPRVVDPMTGRALGATHIELLGDQCTLLYTLGNDAANNRVGRLNICTRQAEADFATLTLGEYAGAIRQLPNGDVLVANGIAVLHFTAAGALLRMYPFQGVTHIALTPDGASFWAAGVSNGDSQLRHIEWKSPFAAEEPPVALGNPEMQTVYVPIETTDLVVVGEWRAAAPQPKAKGRAIRH